MPVLYRNGCTNRADILRTTFSRPMLRCVFGKLSPKIRILPFQTLSQTLLPRHTDRRRCDINNDSGRSDVDSTWGDESAIYSRRPKTADCSQSMSSSVYRAMVDWEWGTVARVQFAWDDILVLVDSSSGLLATVGIAELTFPRVWPWTLICDIDFRI